jgi:hypothetical protein
MASAMLPAIIGIIGVIVGVSLNEIFRRRSRIEKFTEPYFKRKIEVSEILLQDFLVRTALFEDLTQLEADKKSKMGVWHESVLEYLGWMDRNFLFLGDELTVHIGSTLVLAGEYIDGAEGITKERVLSEFGDTKLLIKKSLGFNYIEKSFTNTSKSKLSSATIKFYRDLKENKVKTTKH